MAVQKRGITEKSLFVFNPLPALTDAEVLEKAKLDDLARAAGRSPFIIEWQYSAGHEREDLVLRPGQRAALRESDAAACMRDNAERGLVTHELDATPEQIEKAAAEGLKRAITFYVDRGAKRLQELRKRHSLTAEEMEERRHDFWSFHYNQAAADLLRAHLAKATKAASKTKAA